MNKLDKRIADLPKSLSHLLERVDDLNAQWLLNDSIAMSKLDQPGHIIGQPYPDLEPVAQIESAEDSTDKDVVNADNG